MITRACRIDATTAKSSAKRVLALNLATLHRLWLPRGQTRTGVGTRNLLNPLTNCSLRVQGRQDALQVLVVEASRPSCQLLIIVGRLLHDSRSKGGRSGRATQTKAGACMNTALRLDSRAMERQVRATEVRTETLSEWRCTHSCCKETQRRVTPNYGTYGTIEGQHSSSRTILAGFCELQSKLASPRVTTAKHVRSRDRALKFASWTNFRCTVAVKTALSHILTGSKRCSNAAWHGLQTTRAQNIRLRREPET